MIFEVWLGHLLVYAQQRYYKTEDDFKIDDLRSYYDTGFGPEEALEEVLAEE